MGVIKEVTLQESDGLDQLDNNVGSIISGDVVTIRYKGWYVDGMSGKRNEFDDMFHSEKKIHFTVDKKTNTSEIFRGLNEGVKLMVLGEKASLVITSDYGFGPKEYKGYCGVVPPNSELVLDLAVLSVIRDNKVHNRKQPEDNSGICLKCLSYMFGYGMG